MMFLVTKGARKDTRLVVNGQRILRNLKVNANRAHRRDVNRKLCFVASNTDMETLEQVEFYPKPRHRVTGWDVC